MNQSDFATTRTRVSGVRVFAAFDSMLQMGICEREGRQLCPGCTACPEVEVVREVGEVRIGEIGNLAVLNKGAWNTLVALIQSGRLAKL